jgi:polyisoprenoid-binding protein YceI
MRTFLAALAAAALIAPCAHAQPAPPALNKVPALVKPGAYTVEPTHTRVLFAVDHLGFTTWYGQFTNVAGTLTLDPLHPAGSTFDITIPAITVSTSNTTLDGELNSPEWFDTAKFPTIAFKSEKITRTGKTTAKITGELTFHGVTRPETLAVTFNASGINMITKAYTVGFNATGTIKRSDFNQTTYLPVIGDDVTLIISAAFVQS